MSSRQSREETSIIKSGIYIYIISKEICYSLAVDRDSRDREGFILIIGYMVKKKNFF